MQLPLIHGPRLASRCCFIVMLRPSNTPPDLLSLSQEFGSIKQSGTWLYTFSSAPQTLLFRGEFILLLRNQLHDFSGLKQHTILQFLWAVFGHSLTRSLFGASQLPTLESARTAMSATA